MELLIRSIGVLFRIINIILKPWFYFYSRKAVPPPRDEILFKSAAELAADIRHGKLTSEKVVNVYIKRIQEVNPYINAVTDDRFEAAVKDARNVDFLIEEARRNGTIDILLKDKPLLGIPCTIKESCSVKGLSNCVGRVEYAGSRATVDGDVVRLVKEAGAIPLLVSNTPELCLGYETRNVVTGVTNNPYDINRTPGGSSGGEGALLGSGSSVFGVGSDIAGSIRIPSAFCGIFGHKPTPRILSIKHHVPLLEDENFSRYMVLGPMTKKAEDLSLLLNIMAGDNRKKFNLDKPVDLKSLRVYYMERVCKHISLIDVDSAIRNKIVEAATYLRDKCGCQVADEKISELKDSLEIGISVFFQMKDIPKMLQDPANPKKDINLVIEILKLAMGMSTRSLQSLLVGYIDKTKLFITESRQRKYQEQVFKLQEKLQRTLGENGVLLYPAYISTAYHHLHLQKICGILYTLIFNILGFPVTTVPMGLCNGMPIALQVIAAPNQDRLCLAVAKELEVGFGGWRPPC